MTLILSEREVGRLIDMKEVVHAVEEAFRRQGSGEAANSPRTRSVGSSSVLSVMHANLAYLRRGGLKAYMSSRSGTGFAVLLFDAADSTLLAVMGADTIGRYRTGAASGVATKFLYGNGPSNLAVLGTGRQALTQVLGLGATGSIDRIRVWSPSPDHRKAFATKLASLGFEVSASDSAGEATEEADVVTTITSSAEPFLTERMLGSVSHVNACGGNVPGHSELTPEAIDAFDSVVVDDLPQARIEYGDLIKAAGAGRFNWEEVTDLGSIVAGSRQARGRTLFKSGGAALEDVAVASMLYDKAMKSGADFRSAVLT